MNPITNPALKTTETGSAIVLYATTGAALSPGQTLGVTNINDLRNPLQVPMLVDEIIFNLDVNAGAGQPTTPSLNGGDIRVALKLGSDQLTMTYTPLWLLGKQRNLSCGNLGVTSIGSGAIEAQVTLFSMRLSSQLIVYPGEYLDPMFFHAGVLSPTAVNIRMIVKGRVMAANAQRQSLPYVSFWAGALNLANANYTEETKEADLSNPFGGPLFIDRMIGAIGDVAIPYSNANSGLYQDPAAIDAGLNYCTVRMSDEMGRQIIRDPTPFGHLFQMQTFSWEMKATMPQSSFWKAYLSELYTNINSTGFSLQAMMSVVGKRAVSS